MNTPVWNTRQIARDFVVNLEPMPRDTQIEGLELLIRYLRHKAERDVLYAAEMANHPLALAASGQLEALSEAFVFHNSAVERTEQDDEEDWSL